MNHIEMLERELDQKTHHGQLYTLAEIAEKICASYGAECIEGVCPGFRYCRQRKNGVLEWLRKVVEDGSH